MLNGLWVLIWSVVALIIFVVLLHRIQDKIEGTAEQKEPRLLLLRMRLASRIFIGICLGFVAIAAVAIVGSEEGAAAMVTRQTIESWFLEHGPYIIAVLAIAYLLYRLTRLLMPKMAGASGSRGAGKKATYTEWRVKPLGNYSYSSRSYINDSF